MPGKIATTRSFIFTWIRTPQEAFQPQTFPVWSAGHSLHIGVNTWPRANQGHLLQSTGWKHTSLEVCSDFAYFLLVTQSAHIKYHLHEGKGSFHLKCCSVYASTVEKRMGFKWKVSYSCSPRSYHTPAEPRREPRTLPAPAELQSPSLTALQNAGCISRGWASNTGICYCMSMTKAILQLQ